MTTKIDKKTAPPPAPRADATPASASPPPAAPIPPAAPKLGWLAGAYNAVKDAADKVDLTLAKDLGPALAKVGFTLDAKPGTPPALKQPVVMIPGFTMQAASYDPMAQHLASRKENGPVVVYTAVDGQFHQGSAHGKVLTAAQAKGAKIFEVEYSNPSGASVDPKRVNDLSSPSGKA